MNTEQFNQFTLEAFITQREAMKAANKQRAWQGNAPAYSEENFLTLENQILDFRNSR